MLRFCFEQVFDKWNQFSHNKGMKFCVVFVLRVFRLKVRNDGHVLGLGFEA